MRELGAMGRRRGEVESEAVGDDVHCKHNSEERAAEP